MPRKVTVTLENGERVEFVNVPDSVTPDQIAARAQQETGQNVVTIDGGAGGAAPAAAVAAAPAPAEAAEETMGPPPEGEYYDVPSAPDTKAFESAVGRYYASLPKGTAPEEAKLSQMAVRYGLPPVSNFPEILEFYEKYGTLNPTAAMQGPSAIPPPPPEIEEIVGTVEPAGDWTQRTRAFGKGLLFDFADELEAAGRMLASGELSSDEYYRIKNQINADYNAWAKANPEEATALELAGGVTGTFIPGVGIVGKGVQLGRGAGALARGALAGGSTGALSGLGQAETMALSDIGPSVFEQAAIGTIGGGLVGKGTDLAGRGFARLRSAASPEERRASEILLNATQGGEPVDAAIDAARLSRAYGVPTPLGMTTPELAALSERALTRPGAPARGLAQTLAETQAEAGERVAQQARSALPTGRDFFDAQNAVTQRLRQIGDQDYKRAYAVGEVRDPQIDALVNNPELAGIWKEAQTLARLNGSELRMRMEPVFDEGGSLVGLAPTKDAIPNVEALDYFKRALDDQIDAGFRGSASGGKSRAAALRDNIRRPLVSRLDDLVPEYREARSKYAGDLEVREALDYGRDMLSRKLRPQEVEQTLSGMSVAEREAVKTGALQALLEPLEDATRRGNVAQQIIGAGEGGTSKLAKLRSVMEPAEYHFFETAMRLERDLYNRASKATGGSRTVPLAQGVAQIDEMIGAGRLEDAVNFILAGPQGRTAALVRWVGRFNPNREFGDRVYTQLSDALRAQNPDELAAVLDMLARSESYARAMGVVGDIAAQRVAPAVGGAAPSLVEDRGINPPPALAIGDPDAAVDDAAAAAQATLDAPVVGEDAAADDSEPEVSTVMIDGREAIYDPTAGAHIFTDTNEFVDTTPMKRGGAVKGYKAGGEVSGGYVATAPMSEAEVGQKVMALIQQGRSADEIRSFLNSVRAGLGDEAKNLDANVDFYRKNFYIQKPVVDFTSILEDARMPFARRGSQVLGAGADLVDLLARYIGQSGGYREALNRRWGGVERNFAYRGGTGAQDPDFIRGPARLSSAVSDPQEVPTAVGRVAPRAARAAADYAQRATPSGLVRDIGSGVSSVYEGIKEDPYSFAADAVMYSSPVLAMPAAAFDAAEMREVADEFGGSEGELFDAMSVLPLTGVPFSRRVSTLAVKPKRRKTGGVVNGRRK